MPTRRSLLRGLGAAGFVLAADGWLGRAISRADGEAAPARFLLVHRPNGTIDHQWLPGGVPGPILEPFAALSPRVIRGLRIVPSGNGASTHEGGMVTLATGAPTGPTRSTSPDDWRNTAASIDRTLASRSPCLSGTRHPTLELTAHGRQDGSPEVANRTLSYDGPDLPVYPETSPQLVYGRLFGSLMPGGDTEENRLALERARLRRRSVLDFARGDLATLRSIAPASERERLDAHEAAVRELERMLDETGGGAGLCTLPGDPGALDDTDDFRDVRVVGEQHLAIVRAAMVCDLSRVASFMWSTSASRVSFEGLFSGMDRVQHHSLSHNDLGSESVWRPLAAIDRWYAERTAELVASLASTPDPWGGMLLDRTLVMYLSEVSAGNHTFHDLPVVLFGGSEIGLAPGPVIDVGDRSTNDLWLAVAQRFGVPLTSLGTADQYEGPLDLFV